MEFILVLFMVYNMSALFLTYYILGKLDKRIEYMKEWMNQQDRRK